MAGKLRAQREAKNLGKILKGFLEIILSIVTVLPGMLLASWLLVGLTELPIWGGDLVYEYEDVLAYFIDLLLIVILFVVIFKTCRKFTS
jgi:hypothetical protein